MDKGRIYRRDPEIIPITKSKEIAQIKFEFAETLLKKLSVPLVKSDSSVLDIGCGEGQLLEYLQDRGIDAVGTELIDSPRHRLFNVLMADAHNLPFEDGSFDIVWSSGIYDPDLYDQRPDIIFEEVIRVLKDRGFYIIDDADQPHIPNDHRILKIIDNYRITETAKLSVLGVMKPK